MERQLETHWEPGGLQVQLGQRLGPRLAGFSWEPPPPHPVGSDSVPHTASAAGGRDEAQLGRCSQLLHAYPLQTPFWWGASPECPVEADSTLGTPTHIAQPSKAPPRTPLSVHSVSPQRCCMGTWGHALRSPHIMAFWGMKIADYACI